MAVDENSKLIHKTCEACGDDKCTITIVKTTESDKENYSKRNDLATINPYLIKIK